MKIEINFEIYFKNYLVSKFWKIDLNNKDENLFKNKISGFN